MRTQKFRKHWAVNSKDFAAKFKSFNQLLSELILLSEDASKQFSGAKKPLENTAFLLLGKSLNHILSSQVLLEKGLLIDAALTTRNALETLLLLQAILLDPEEKYALQWLNGKQFKPSWARKRLEKVQDIKVRDVVVSSSDDVNKMAYSWLSDITHANLSSFGYSMSSTGNNSYEVYIGGSIKGQEAPIKAIYAVLLSTLLQATVLTTCVLCLPWFETKAETFKKIQSDIDEITRT
ncbi:MAG: DUF5677 domain-containing protein [Candidatus Sedimenticola sp. (ex Thyasira tokunagai)]